MDGIRLKEHSFNFEGKEYKLRCNFNVLADVQEACGGSIPDIFDPKKTLKNSAIFLAAMMNDYADEQGWPERFTARQIGRKIDFKDGLLTQRIINLVISATFLEGEINASEPKN